MVITSIKHVNCEFQYEFFLWNSNRTCSSILLLVLSFTRPFHRYSTTIRGPRSAERSVDGGSLATSIFACLYTCIYKNMHIIVGDTFLRLKISQLPWSHFERRSKYMGQRTLKGCERNIRQILTDFGNGLRRGDSKNKFQFSPPWENSQSIAISYRLKTDQKLPCGFFPKNGKNEESRRKSTCDGDGPTF